MPLLAEGSFVVTMPWGTIAFALLWIVLCALVGLVAARTSGRAGWFTLYFALSLVLTPLVGTLACLGEIAVRQARITS
jgi:amino acid transporter